MINIYLHNPPHTHLHTDDAELCGVMPSRTVVSVYH